MSKILLRTIAACMVVLLTTLFLAACGANKQESNDGASRASIETASNGVIGDTIQRISEKLPRVGESLPLPTATPRHEQSASIAVVDVVLLPTVTPTPPRLAGGYLGVVAADQLNVRADPDTVSNVIAALGKQECVTLLEIRDGWYRIAMPSDESGWAHGEFIQVVAECPTPAPPDLNATGGSVVAFDMEVSAVALEVVEAAEIAQPVNFTQAPMVTNAALVNTGNIHECFGTGDDEVREVSANTPVEVLGTGPFWPPEDQQDRLGEGPYLKIRLWDGQFAWIAARHVGFDIAQATEISGQCEESDRLDWFQVVRPTATAMPRDMPTPRPVAQPVAQPVTRAMPTPRPVVSGASRYEPTPTPTITPTPTPTQDNDHKWFDE